MLIPKKRHGRSYSYTSRSSLQVNFFLAKYLEQINFLISQMYNILESSELYLRKEQLTANVI